MDAVGEVNALASLGNRHARPSNLGLVALFHRWANGFLSSERSCSSKWQIKSCTFMGYATMQPTVIRRRRLSPQRLHKKERRHVHWGTSSIVHRI